ncbi:MAG: glycosyltransferase N-terminal domain-containing protein [Bacillota bacterium]
MSTLLYITYNFLTLLLTVALLLPYLLYLMVRGRQEEAQERLGLLASELYARSQGQQVIWLQAASVGEVRVAAQLIKELEKEADQSYFYLLTVMTPAGRKLAREEVKEADVISYLPFDFAPLIKRFAKKFQPDLLILIETELWPSLIREAVRQGTAVTLVNGRLSDKSFPRYQKLRSFMQMFLTEIDRFYMQSSQDAERIIALGAAEERVNQMANLKYPGALAAAEADEDNFGEKRQETPPLLVGGSTHPGEEEALLKFYHRLKQAGATTPLVILAPRHIERTAEVVDLVETEECRYELWSELARKQGDSAIAARIDLAREQEVEVIVVDTIGDLADIYHQADLAFIGGTLAEIGGHNFLEPLAAGVPVILGPHRENITGMLADFVETKGIYSCGDREEVFTWLRQLLNDPEERVESGRAGFRRLQAKAKEVNELAASILSLLPLGQGFSKLLFVRLSAIGDVVHTLPAFSLLAQHRPEYQLDWLVEPLSEPLVSCHKDLHQLQLLPRGRWRGGNSLALWPKIKDIKAWLAGLQEEDYDLSLDMHGLAKSAVPAYFARPNRRYGPAAGGEGSSLFYQKKLPQPAGKCHQIDKKLQLLAAALGIELPPDHQIDYGLQLPDEWEEDLPEEMQELLRLKQEKEPDQLEPQERYIIVHPKTSWPSKDWSVEKFSELIEEFVKKGVNIVLSGGPAETVELAELTVKINTKVKNELAENAEAETKAGGRIYCLAGGIDLIELYGLAARADLFISGDTGPLHIAVAAGADCLALMGPSDPETHGPYGDKHKVIRREELDCLNCWKEECPLGHHKCMEDITVQQVETEALNLLGRKGYDGSAAD